MSLSQLAAQIKVSVSKLQSLERGEFEALGDANLTRALASTVCRALRVDHRVILDRLPQARMSVLGDEPGALNTPLPVLGRKGSVFDARYAPSVLGLLRSKWFAPGLFILLAALIYFSPAPLTWPTWTRSGTETTSETSEHALDTPAPLGVPTSAEQASSASADLAGDSRVSPALQSNASAADVSVGASAAMPSSSPSTDSLNERDLSLKLSLVDQSWIEVVDASGEKLLSRIARAGETVSLDGQPPFKLHIGNASAVQVSYRGEPVILQNVSRNNTARLELK